MGAVDADADAVVFTRPWVKAYQKRHGVAHGPHNTVYERKEKKRNFF